MYPANERQRYIVTSSLIGWVHTQNNPCVITALDHISIHGVKNGVAHFFLARRDREKERRLERLDRLRDDKEKERKKEKETKEEKPKKKEPESHDDKGMFIADI